ncbi:MAG: ATPase, T2SS/T4P/T4SS family, partial [Candidatus Aenigmatarchaeota archaeon]
MGVAESREAYNSWLRRQELEKAPFTFEIMPNLQVGYRDQILRLLKNIDQKQKIVLITGPTGSGKTTLLNYIGSSEKDIVFMSKPPRKTEDLLKIPNHFSTEIPVLTRIFTKKPGDVQEIPQYLNKVLSGHKVLFVDEAHEASID